MKNIVSINKVTPEGSVTINFKNFYNTGEFSDFISEKLPYNKLFEVVKLVNVKVLPSELLARLTHHYLHGTKVVLENLEFQVKNPQPFYSYSFTKLDLTKPLPKSLAYHKFTYKNKEITVLDMVRTLTTVRYLPNELWNAIDEYSQNVIRKVREINRGDYEQAEMWYKKLMKIGFKNNIQVYSPNKKTYYEAVAELDFVKCLDRTEERLTDEQLAFVQKYAPIYGLEIPQFNWRFNTRKTDHGYTAEPERVLYLSESDANRSRFDKRNNNNLPREQRDGLAIKTNTDHKGLIDTYNAIKWLQNNLGDEAFAETYHRCPECNEIFHEFDGCGCGQCRPIQQVRAEHLLYGIRGTYEDYDSTGDTYIDLINDMRSRV